MSSAFSPRHESPSKTWWSLSKAPSSGGQDLRRAYSTERSRQAPTKSSGINFNTFASAMGFKSKKHPSLTIQDPPLPTRAIIPPPPTGGHYMPNSVNRPPSKSVSSTQSKLDSLEPRTPVDKQHDPRRSLLTLSDLDPFAGRGFSVPHTPSDPNRLSAYSNASIPELLSKNTEQPIFNRVSYASSSSHSNQHGNELSPISPPLSMAPTADNTHLRKLKAKRSIGSLNRKQSLVVPDNSLVTAWENLKNSNNSPLSKSGSSSTLTEKSRLSQPDPAPAPRPPMRARGMTDSDANQRPGFLQLDASLSGVASPAQKPSKPSHNPISPVTSPRVIIRQASVSRIGSPPSAPPRQELPPPPPLDHVTQDDDSEVAVGLSTGSASSSSLSFASSVSENREITLNQPYSPRQKEKRPANRSFLSSNKLESEVINHMFPKSQSLSITPRTLKKAASHQSFAKPPPSSNSPAPERAASKTPRKQRSFHQQKMARPPIPLPNRYVSPSGSQPSVPPDNSAPVAEPRRGSASGISSPARKRLFSGGSRPSTSQCILSDDDALSVFSLRSEKDQGLGSSYSKPLSPTMSSSFWDEGAHDHTPSSPLPTHEYTPQQIMSPAEMAEVEASVDDSSLYIRKRGLSILSASTIFSDGDEESAAPPGLSPQPWNADISDDVPSRSNSLLSKGLAIPPRLALRPSTSQGNITVTPSSGLTAPKHPTSTQGMASLPPPPRPRPRLPIITQLSSDERFGVSSLPPPPVRRSIRAKISVEKALHRRSIMRKPSFLDIDDDTDGESDMEGGREPLHGSFLDLARESFDTVRSISE